MRGIPVLTYHSLHARGDSYAENDHVALADDLLTLHDQGYVFTPLIEIARRLIEIDEKWFESQPRVGLSFDDGVNHDFIDFEWPGIPTLKSFHTTLREFNDRHRPVNPACGTSFVIASPVATSHLDKTCIAGRGQWNNSWWREAALDGLIDIGNHSWDHLHATLPFVCHSREVRDDFAQVDTALDAAMQIQQAEEFIRQTIGDDLATGLFAYPDGKSNAWLVERWFPQQQQVFAAFTTDGSHVHPNDNRWLIPRYVCGEHWTSTDELVQILQESS